MNVNKIQGDQVSDILWCKQKKRSGIDILKLHNIPEYYPVEHGVLYKIKIITEK